MKRKRISRAKALSYVCRPFEGKCFPMETKEKRLQDLWRESKQLPPLRDFSTPEDCQASCRGLPKDLLGKLHGFTGSGPVAGVAKNFIPPSTARYRSSS